MKYIIRFALQLAVNNGAFPGVVGALAHRIHVPRAGRAVQQRARFRGGRAGGRGRGLPRRHAPGAAHLPVP